MPEKALPWSEIQCRPVFEETMSDLPSNGRSSISPMMNRRFGRNITARIAVNRRIGVCSSDTGGEVESQARNEHDAAHSLMSPMREGRS